MHQRQRTGTQQTTRFIGATLVAVVIAATAITAAGFFNPFCYIFPEHSIEWIAAGCGL